MSFEPFPKMARLFRECTVTEKIDGTNAQVLIEDIGFADIPSEGEGTVIARIGGLAISAGSRSRLITPGKTTDNYGFAAWVRDNAAELVKLGEGRHFGEWWGSGINRGYDLPKGEKRFSLFNTARWNDDAVRPACCHVVPTLYTGQFTTSWMIVTKDRLYRSGSIAAPGFMKPEGIVVWHEAARTLFKSTLENDESPKGLAA